MRAGHLPPYFRAPSKWLAVLIPAIAAGWIAYQPLESNDQRWSLALAAGAAVAAAIFAGPRQEYNQRQAAHTRRQVELLEEQVRAEREERERVEGEARQRSAEAERAAEVARLTLSESVKSRLDVMAPKVSVVVGHAEMLPAKLGEGYDAWMNSKRTYQHRL